MLRRLNILAANYAEISADIEPIISMICEQYKIGIGVYNNIEGACADDIYRYKSLLRDVRGNH